MGDERNLDGRVALVTGAARGQGRSHAVSLAAHGADIVALDIAASVPSAPYPLASPGDLAETVRLVEAQGRRAVAVRGDVRSTGDVARAVEAALDNFARLDILIANAGILSFGAISELSDEMWDDVIGTNLTGVFKCCRAAVEAMSDGGRVVITSSMAGRSGWQNIGHYAASKWGVIGLAKSLAVEVAPRRITVNVVCPSSVNTPMMNNDAAYRLFRPDLDAPTLEDALPAFQEVNVQPVPYAEPSDISDAVLFLVSDDAHAITGSTLSVAAGVNARNI